MCVFTVASVTVEVFTGVTYLPVKIFWPADPNKARRSIN